jgi:hypothetical protein
MLLAWSACGAPAASTPGESPDSPVDSSTKEPIIMPIEPTLKDGNLDRGEIFIEELGLLIRESHPPQIALGFSGNLPTPCHQIRSVVGEPDAENKIHVEVYTVVDPNMMCTQVLQPFMETIELGTFPSGHYSVWLNGQLAGEFDS